MPLTKNKSNVLRALGVESYSLRHTQVAADPTGFAPAMSVLASSPDVILARVAPRNIRKDVLNEVKRAEKAGDVTQDDTKDAETELNRKIDTFQKQIETIEAAKTREVMEI